MATEEEPQKYGERGEKTYWVNLQEGCKPTTNSPNEGRGNSAQSETANRKPPQGGSGTAPPQGKK